jgi:RimJ/RimL family protein N-acetyltransferase
MRLETSRLSLEQVDETTQPEDFLRVFNSHPDFIEASERFTGKRAYDLSDVKRYLWQETVRENSRCLAIRLLETGELIGTAAWVAPHPDKPHPWIGLLLIDAAQQGQGFGAEAAAAIETQLAKEGWLEVRLSVMQTNVRARQFWERLGYSVYDERPDDNQRPCWLMRKALDRSRQPAEV